MTAVQESTSFQGAVSGSDVLIEAAPARLGRRIAFADVTLTGESSGGIAARASTVHAPPS